MAADHRDERIVDALVRLAHALELWVTAEAVETGVQAERLRALRCDTGQGRYFGAPGPGRRDHRPAARRRSGGVSGVPVRSGRWRRKVAAWT